MQPGSNLLDGIIKKRASLKPRGTVVTTTLGQRYVERKNGDGELEIAEFVEPSLGYVVDERPDLQIAEILPYLLLSSQDAAQDCGLLIDNSVTHVLSVGTDLQPGTFASGVVYKKISLLDLPEANVLDVLDECFRFIEEARTTNESIKILIHCNAGYSRSPTIAIAYLMTKYGYGLEKSLQMIKEKRNVRPNAGFMNQLRLLETKLMRQGIIH